MEMKFEWITKRTKMKITPWMALWITASTLLTSINATSAIASISELEAEKVKNQLVFVYCKTNQGFSQKRLYSDAEKVLNSLKIDTKYLYDPVIDQEAKNSANDGVTCSLFPKGGSVFDFAKSAIQNGANEYAKSPEWEQQLTQIISKFICLERAGVTTVSQREELLSPLLEPLLVEIGYPETFSDEDLIKALQRTVQGPAVWLSIIREKDGKNCSLPAGFQK